MEWINALDPKMRMALLGLCLMVVKDLLGWRTAVKKARLEGKNDPPWEWDILILNWLFGFLGGGALGNGAEIVTTTLAA